MLEFADRSDRQMSYDDAVLYCSFLRSGGWTDWRLPTEQENTDEVGLFGHWYEGRTWPSMCYVVPVRSIMYNMRDYLPNPFTTDYQYSDVPLDLYTEEHMVRFAESIIRECSKLVSQPEVKSKILKYFGVK